MAEPNKPQDRDELFWLFPVLLVVAIIAVTVIIQPGSCRRGPGGMGQYNPLPEGAPQGQVSGVQGESTVVIPESDNTGVRTLDDLRDLFETYEDIYQSEEEPDSTGTFQDSVVPGPGLRIVVKSNIEEEDNWDIYLMDETGYNPVRLTTFPSVERFPSITADGSRVYFLSDRDDDPNNPNPFAKNTEIYMIDMELFGTDAYTGPTRLTFNNDIDYGVSISADGTRMVYASASKDNPSNPVIIIADGDANNGKVIADTRLENTLPKISGDGNYVVYNSFLDGEMDIFLYDVRGDYTVNLTNSDIPEYFPTINYDGSVIVYEKLLGGTPTAVDLIEIFACDRDGGNERQITFNRFADTMPALTDDGQWLIFVSRRWDFNGDGHYDETLFYMDISGENVYKITKDPFYEEEPDV